MLMGKNWKCGPNLNHGWLTPRLVMDSAVTKAQMPFSYWYGAGGGGNNQGGFVNPGAASARVGGNGGAAGQCC